MRRFAPAAAFAATLLQAGLVLAEDTAEGNGHGGELTMGHVLADPTFLGSVLNFTLLIFVLTFLFKKPLSEFLKNRSKQVEEGLAEAARIKAAAEAKHQEYSDRLEKLDSELETLRSDMVKAGEVEKDRIVAEAEKKAARMRRETEFLIEQQMKQLREDLTREAVEAAVGAAEAVLTEKTTAADQQKLADTYLERVAVVVKEGRA